MLVEIHVSVGYADTCKGYTDISFLPTQRAKKKCCFNANFHPYCFGFLSPSFSNETRGSLAVFLEEWDRKCIGQHGTDRSQFPHGPVHIT